MVAELALSFSFASVFSLSLSLSLSLLSAASGFRGNITRKWWLACECRYHFLARYQPALPVITAPPGLRHGLLDKPPTAKVYCLFHLPSPFYRSSFPFHPTLLAHAFSCSLLSCSLYASLSLSLSLSFCTSLAILATLQPLPTLGRCIELFENRPKRREITWENGYVVRPAPADSYRKGPSIDSSANRTDLSWSKATCWRTFFAGLLSALSWIIEGRTEEGGSLQTRNTCRVTAGDNARLVAEVGFFERELIPGHWRARGMSLGSLLSLNARNLYFNVEQRVVIRVSMFQRVHPRCTRFLYTGSMSSSSPRE